MNLAKKLMKKVQDIIKYDIPSGFDFYNKTATNVFFLLEQSGLGIYYEEFNKLFKPRNPLYNTTDNKVLTSYNLYNATSRPTNAFNSVNFRFAILKLSSIEVFFHPTNDYFVESDRCYSTRRVLL